jgi:hypothetical protein
VVLTLSFIILLAPTLAQQAAGTIQPIALMQQSLAAQLGNTQVSDVTLTGSVVASLARTMSPVPSR